MSRLFVAGRNIISSHAENQAAIELQGISVASDDQWEDLKDSIERIWHEAQKLLHDAIAKTSG